MSKFRLFLSNFQKSPNADIQRVGLGRWFEILEVHPMKIFWANIWTFAALIPCTAAAFFMINLWDWLSILLVWITFALAGPAITALHYVCIQIARGRPVWLKEDYLACMKREWKKAILLSALIGALWLVLICNVRTVFLANSGISFPVFMVDLCCAFLLSGFSVFSYQQLAMIELPFFNVIKNGILLIFAGWRAFAAAAFAAVCIILCMYYYFFSYFILLLGFYALGIMTVNFIFLPKFNELFPSETEEE